MTIRGGDWGPVKRYNPKPETTGVRHTGLSATPEYAAARAKHLRAHPSCACCGSVQNVEVHHVVPRHVSPSLECVPANLLTLCRSMRVGMDCHLVIGHLGNWLNCNPKAKDDAAWWRARLKERHYSASVELTGGSGTSMSGP